MKVIARLLPPLALGLACLLGAAPASASDGLLTSKSPYPAKETMNRFEEAAKQSGLMVFARIDHAAGAARIGMTLRPTEVLIFGSPQGGTPFIGVRAVRGHRPAFESAACPAAQAIGRALAGLSEAVVK